MRCACCWSFQNPGSFISLSSSARRAAKRAGSKVLTDPVELGPDLLELFLQRCGVDCHPRDGSRVRGRRRGNLPPMARRPKPRFLRGVVVGWLAAYFYDPRLGRSRRALARDWVRSRARRLMRRGERAQRYATATAIGKTQAFRHRREEPKPQPDDVTLAHKVETIIFRNHEVPKGQISVNAEDGVVWLRGEVPTESMIEALVERTREVTGVRRVESLLHLPGQDAPMHA